MVKANSLVIQLASVSKENIQGDLLQLLLYPKREKKEEKLQVFKCLYQWLKPLKKEKEKKLGLKKKKSGCIILFDLMSRSRMNNQLSKHNNVFINKFVNTRLDLIWVYANTYMYKIYLHGLMIFFNTKKTINDQY